jgi:exopolyphosphatase/guanosine-5'-triphosphate,3'-diphosphate pyrophosphatase
MTRIAAVDVGSNSALFCVGEPLPGKDFRVVYDSARTTRLGEGLDRTGRLSPAAIRRTIRVLSEFRRKAQILGVGVAKAVATAAVREAGNPEAFLGPAEEALGFPVRTISGEREAELTYRGVAGPASTERLVLLDVGGASTEIVLAGEGRIERIESLPVGAARLKEAIPSEDILRFFVRVIEVIPSDLDPSQVEGRRAVAVGGTATTLAAMRLALRRYEPDAVEGVSFSRAELSGLVERIRGLSMPERIRLPGLPTARAEIITSGGLILVQILEDLGIDRVAISARGLRHGLLAELVR